MAGHNRTRRMSTHSTPVSRLRSFAENLQRQPQPRVTDANVLDVLAAVGDGSHTSAERLKAELSKPGLRLVGTYRFSVEEMTLDGTLSNTPAMLRGRECLLDTVAFHVDTQTTGPNAFTGAMSISYEARQPDECVCRYWFKFSAQRN